MDLKQQEKQAESDPTAEQPEGGTDTSDNNPATVRKRHRPRSYNERRRGKASSSVAFPTYVKGRQVGTRRKSTN
ncbi:hypothetical protein MMC15_008365 [Xylographa vitiligo]|nr:hypothetical protein [Xylographa vitiligo]